MGRRAHQPDPAQRRQVEAMAAYGIPETDISRVVGIDPKTLRKHYREELDLGETKANAQVAGFLFNCGQERQRHRADLLAQDPGALEGGARPSLAYRRGRHLTTSTQLTDAALSGSSPHRLRIASSQASTERALELQAPSAPLRA